MKCKSFLKRCKVCSEENTPQKKVCAKCGTDLKCSRDAVNGYTLCAVHGGPVPSRNFYGVGTMKDGSSSSFPITRLAAKYNQMQSDGRVLSNRATIEIIDVRIKQLLDRVDVEDAPERMSALYNLWKEYEGYIERDDKVNVVLARKSISETFEKAFHDYQGWKQIFEALDLRGKSVEREVKTLTAINAFMTAEQGYELTAKLFSIVLRILKDEPKKLKEAQYEFARLIGESSDNTAEGFVEENGGGGEASGGESGFGDVD